MKLFVQYATDPAEGWVQIDSSEWNLMPKKPLPVGGETLDAGRGWIHALNVQGVKFVGYDHYAVEDEPTGSLRVSAWKDDASFSPPGMFYARVWHFRPLRPDPALGRAYNTNQSQILYANSEYEAVHREFGPVGGLEIHPFTAFPMPAAVAVRHGILEPQDVHDALEALQVRHGWREWTDGVPATFVKDGRLVGQRALGRYNKPLGTKTFICSDLPNVVSVHNAEFDATSNDESLLTTTGTPTEESGAKLAGGEATMYFGFTTESGQPNSGAWPTGNYRCQLDCTQVGADLVYGLRATGGVNGHFGRVDSGLTSDLETKEQTEALFSGTGLKLATTGSVSWSTGAASDRFECMMAASRPTNMGNQDITLELNESDDFADGPWSDAILLQASTSLSLAAVGALTTEIHLAGLASLSLADAATLTTAITMSAASSASLDAVAALSTAITLAAAESLSLAAVPSLTTAITLAAAESFSLGTVPSLTTAIALAGTESLTLGSTSALTTVIALAGAESLSLTTTADLTAAGQGAEFQAAENLTLATGAGLTTAIPLVVAVPLTLGTVGALSTQIALAALAELAATATAGLTTTILLEGAGTVRLTVQPGLTTEISLEAAEALALQIQAALTTVIQFAADATAALTTDGTLTTGITLEVTGPVVLTVSATLTVGTPVASFVPYRQVIYLPRRVS